MVWHGIDICNIVCGYICTVYNVCLINRTRYGYAYDQWSAYGTWCMDLVRSPGEWQLMAPNRPGVATWREWRADVPIPHYD